jgi:hypothetical protein
MANWLKANWLKLWPPRMGQIEMKCIFDIEKIFLYGSKFLR